MIDTFPRNTAHNGNQVSAVAEYRDLDQMIEEITTLSRRLSGTTGTGISASRGKGQSHSYAVTQRALDRLGLATLEDFRPVQCQHLEHLRRTCQQVANSVMSTRAEKMTAAVGFGAANILLDGLDDIVDEPVHRRELEVTQ